MGVLLLASAVVTTSGCGKKNDSVVAIGEGKRLSAQEIDADPLALLPGGAVMVGKLDAKAMLASSVGTQAVTLSRAVVPLTPDMGFDPHRDLTTLYLAGYAGQTAVAAGIAQGQFDVEAIKKAAERGAISALNKPLRKVEYAGNDLYTTADVGFVVLTTHTILYGNPEGMRRALERLRDGRVKREMPDWLVDLLKTPNAELVVGGEPGAHGAASAVAQQNALTRDVTVVRVVGDFAPPGMNFAGAVTYNSAQAAQVGEAQMKQVVSDAGSLNSLGFFGLSSPIKSFESNVAQSDVRFKTSIDGPALASLLGWGTSMMPWVFGASAGGAR